MLRERSALCIPPVMMFPFIQWTYEEFDESKGVIRIHKSKEWVNDCCLTPIQQFSAISWREQVNFQ